MNLTRFWLRAGLVGLIGIATPITAVAQDATGDLDIFDGPTGHLLTRSDRAALQQVSGAEEARRFVQLFWARRDPDLTTWRNEFRREFDLRVEMADSMFGQGSTRGAMTDRGRVFILLGPFDAQYDKPRGTVTGDSRFTVDEDRTIRYTERPAIELWEYDLTRYPDSVGEGEAMAIFVETQAGQKNFVLDREHRRNATVIRMLGEAPDWYVAHPDLTEIPDLGLVRGSRAANPTEMAWLDAAATDDPALDRRVEIGMISDAEQWLWVHTEGPQEGPQPSRLIGRLTAPDGRVLGSFSTPATALADRTYEVAIGVDPGLWTLEMAVTRDDGPLAAIREAVEVEPLPPSGSVFSPLYWGVEGTPQPEAYLGDPYRVGGWQISPRPNRTLTTEETLIFACSLIRPLVEDGGEPGVLTAMTVAKDGKTFYRGEPRPAAVAQVTPLVWVFGGRLGMSRLPGPGEYALEVAASQPADGTRRVMRFEFTVAAP